MISDAMISLSEGSFLTPRSVASHLILGQDQPMSSDEIGHQRLHSFKTIEVLRKCSWLKEGYAGSKEIANPTRSKSLKPNGPRRPQRESRVIAESRVVFIRSQHICATSKVDKHRQKYLQLELACAAPKVRVFWSTLFRCCSCTNWNWEQGQGRQVVYPFKRPTERTNARTCGLPGQALHGYTASAKSGARDGDDAFEII